MWIGPLHQVTLKDLGGNKTLEQVIEMLIGYMSPQP
jgi:hypothetical protein